MDAKKKRIGGNRKNHASLLRLACGQLVNTLHTNTVYRGAEVIPLATLTTFRQKAVVLPWDVWCCWFIGRLFLRSATIAKTIFFLPCCGSLMVRFTVFVGLNHVV